MDLLAGEDPVLWRALYLLEVGQFVREPERGGAGILQEVEARLMHVLLLSGICAVGFLVALFHEFQGNRNGQVEIDDDVRARNAEDLVLHRVEEGQKFAAFGGRFDLPSLMDLVGRDVAVGDDDVACGQIAFDLFLRLEAVGGIQHGRDLRMHVQEIILFLGEAFADEGAEEIPVVLGKVDHAHGLALLLQALDKQSHLRALTGAVRAVDDYELAGGFHTATVPTNRRI